MLTRSIKTLTHAACVADKEKVLYVPDIIHGTETAQMEMLQVFSKEDLSHFEKKELDVLCPTHDKPRSNRTFNEPLAYSLNKLLLVLTRFY